MIEKIIFTKIALFIKKYKIEPTIIIMSYYDFTKLKENVENNYFYNFNIDGKYFYMSKEIKRTTDVKDGDIRVGVFI